MKGLTAMWSLLTAVFGGAPAAVRFRDGDHSQHDETLVREPLDGVLQQHNETLFRELPDGILHQHNETLVRDVA